MGETSAVELHTTVLYQQTPFIMQCLDYLAWQVKQMPRVVYHGSKLKALPELDYLVKCLLARAHCYITCCNWYPDGCTESIAAGSCQTCAVMQQGKGMLLCMWH